MSSTSEPIAMPGGADCLRDNVRRLIKSRRRAIPKPSRFTNVLNGRRALSFDMLDDAVDVGECDARPALEILEDRRRRLLERLAKNLPPLAVIQRMETRAEWRLNEAQDAVWENASLASLIQLRRAAQRYDVVLELLIMRVIRDEANGGLRPCA